MAKNKRWKTQNYSNNDRTYTNIFLSIPSPMIAETLALQGWDAITIDFQHGLGGYADVVAMLRAIARTSVLPVVRMPSLDAADIGRVLDAGALGIIGPMIERPEDAQHLVRACFYPPIGVRSFGPSRAGPVHGPDYVSQSETNILPIAMIETKEALENVETIAATVGLKGLYVGPNDLGLALGLGIGTDRNEPEMIAAFTRISEAAKANGILAGIHCMTVANATKMRRQFEFTTIGWDTLYLAGGAADALKAFRKIDSDRV